MDKLYPRNQFTRRMKGISINVTEVLCTENEGMQSAQFPDGVLSLPVKVKLLIFSKSFII